MISTSLTSTLTRRCPCESNPPHGGGEGQAEAPMVAAGRSSAERERRAKYRAPSAGDRPRRSAGRKGAFGVATAMAQAPPCPRHRDEQGGQDEGTGEKWPPSTRLCRIRAEVRDHGLRGSGYTQLRGGVEPSPSFPLKASQWGFERYWGHRPSDPVARL
jgi:hypothetical protein